MIDGPRLKPASGAPAKSLVIFLHGYGADGSDLIDIGRHWAEVLPDTAFVSPHAPEPCAEAPGGRQWFGLTMRDEAELWRGVTKAAPTLDAFLEEEIKRYALVPEKVALCGFSQGTMMALYVGPRRSRPIAGIVGYSGVLAGPDRLKAEAKSKPPVLLVHGAEDPLIPAGAILQAAQGLGAASIDVEWHVRPDLQHGIDGEGLNLGAGFLRRVLNARP
jgi:phospholipase/carboxylesterase